MAALFFQGKRKLLKNRERWKNFQYSLYIHLGVIRVIWAGVVCNLDQIVIGYSGFDQDQALFFCKNRTIGCR